MGAFPQSFSLAGKRGIVPGVANLQGRFVDSSREGFLRVIDDVGDHIPG